MFSRFLWKRCTDGCQEGSNCRPTGLPHVESEIHQREHYWNDPAVSKACCRAVIVSKYAFEVKVLHSCAVRKQLCLSRVVKKHDFRPRHGCASKHLPEISHSCAVRKQCWRGIHSCAAQKQICPLLLNGLVFGRQWPCQATPVLSQQVDYCNYLSSKPNRLHDAEGRRENNKQTTN